MERPTQSLSHQSCELCVWVAKLAHTVLSGGYAESDTAITLHEARALDALGRKEFWTMSEFAKALSVSLSTASHTADMLVRKRVVKRSKSPLDRRIVLISLSGKGLKRQEALFEGRVRICSALLKQLGPAERQETMSAIQRLVELCPNPESIHEDRINK